MLSSFLADYEKTQNGKSTFLHVFAEKHNLADLFDKIEKSDVLCTTLNNLYNIQNQSGNAFIGIAIKNIQENVSVTQKEIEHGIKRALEVIRETSSEEIFSDLCKSPNKLGNTILHMAVYKSQKKLISYLLPSTPSEANEYFNKDGHNALQVAVFRNNAEIIKHILESYGNIFHANDKMSNGETSLHLAAKQLSISVLEELIKHGGDLSLRDEDGHTPLHDCLQQVYFEGEGVEDGQKCDKFIRIWNKVVDEAVTWRCTKQELGTDSKRLAMNPEKYLPLQYKAVYYLRSCIKNNSGLTVLQYAADRGLVPYVQAMLTTKDAFFISSKTKMDFKIDVTNLCQEYSVPAKNLYTKREWSVLHQKGEHKEEAEDDTEEKEGNEELFTFMDALTIVKPGEKAGEILEPIPMITLTKLQWHIYQWFSIIWMLIHFLLMSYITCQSRNEVPTTRKGFLEKSAATSKLDAVILFYSLFVLLLNFLVKITIKCRSKLPYQEEE